ncbi:MAG TPA: site-specific DNA-methyltransferase [Anaerolineales bacterium]|nr:site-specific DNA-methyltransferase [Anaerolineales bacterium]
MGSDGAESDSTLLRVHLDRYTARNTFDYFIHKDLGGFLRRELDFYIKNEVMHLDDVESETAPRVEQYLSKIKVIRRIAGKIITFLAQVEDFQKKLWLKKKFVVETSWCVRVGCIPEAFYADIAANERQREEWVRLLAIDGIEGDLMRAGYSVPLTPAFFKGHPTLMVDTRLFDSDFTWRLLDAIGDVDGQMDGLVAHSENFQALGLLEQRYRGQVECIYIDPPYNTDAGPISYKNGYRSSSWTSMIADRLFAATRILDQATGILCATIDHYQYKELRFLIEEYFGRDSIAGTVAIRNNPSGRPVPSGFSQSHEYAIFARVGPESEIGLLPRTDAQRERYRESDKDGPYMWELFRKRGSNSERKDRPSLYYPIYFDGTMPRIPRMTWDAERRDWIAEEKPKEGETVLWPIDENGIERTWRWKPDVIIDDPTQLSVKDKDGLVVYYKFRPNEDGVLPLTIWSDAKYSSTEHGTGTIKRLFSEYNVFSYPKSIYAVEDCIAISGMRAPHSLCLDFFAGSGTTGHAVINLNREDGGRRKFILVEMGEYFDTVLLPRLKKVTFTPEWKDGRPKRLATPEEAERSARIMKVVRLESYEDTLNNLELQRTDGQQGVLDLAQAQGSDGMKEQYLLGYMLDVETRGSQSLLNVAAFTDPTAYRLKVKRPGSDESREVNVDLLETFNWLIGLTVRHIAAPQTFAAEFERDGEGRLRLMGRLEQEADGRWWFRSVTGATPDGRKALVIWRKRPGGETPEGIEQDNLVLDEWFTKQGYSSKDGEFDLIYVNGDNNLENLKAPDDTWKVRLIEEDFHRLMFSWD